MLFNVALASGADVLSTLPGVPGTSLPPKTPGSPAGRWLALFIPPGVRYTETGSL
jgi:hypothetical protein